MNKSGNISHTVRSVVLIIAVIFITADLVTLAPDDHARHRTTTANRQKDNQRSEDPDRRRNMITKMATPGDTRTDLSGTYTGIINYPESGLTGEATLTITGEQFTLTSGSTVYTGRITDLATRGNTAVSLQFDNTTAPAGGQATIPPTSISLRLRKAGGRLTFTSATGERGARSPSPAGQNKRSRPRRRRP